MKHLLLIFISFLFTHMSFGQDLPLLKISNDSSYIVTEDGEPFFWLGDTQWVLFHRTTLQEADRYFANRVKCGFNLIQACITGAGVIEGATDSTHNMVNNTLPFHIKDNLPDPTKPNIQFFEYVDKMVAKAAEYGLYVAILPLWGEYVCPAWQNGPIIFNKENAQYYGEWLGKRYGNNPNIIWVIGGDRNPDKCNSTDIRIYQALANGIKKYDKKHLMTFHPQGGHGSNEWFYNESWLDFHMYQSLMFPERIVKLTTAAYNTTPAKPVINGEPYYFENNLDSTVTDQEIRSQPYWSFLSGANGYTFGQHHVWFFDKNDSLKNFANNSGIYWYDKLNTEATFWIIRFKELISPTEWWKYIPDSTLVTKNKGVGNEEIVVRKKHDGSKFMVYFPINKSAELDLASYFKNKVQLKWYKTDEDKSVMQVIEAGEKKINPPENWSDAFLIIEE